MSVRHDIDPDLRAVLAFLAGFTLIFAVVVWLLMPKVEAACVPTITTPILTWAQVPNPSLASYTIYYNQPGGVPQRGVDVPCRWDDLSDPPDGIKETRTCVGADVALALERLLTLTPFVSYEIRVKAKDAAGNSSANFSTPVVHCPSLIYPGRPAVYN